MKFVHLCLCGPYTDNWSYQDNLLPKELQKKGAKNTVIALMSDYEGKYFSIKIPITYYLDKVKIIRIIPNKNKIKKIFYYYNIYDYLVDEKPDVIFVHGIQTISSLFAVKYKKKVNNKCVIVTDNHANYFNSPLKTDFFHKLFYFVRKKIIQYCSTYFDAIWGLTPDCVKYVKNCFDIKKEVELLPLGYDEDSIDYKNKENIRDSIRKKFSIDKDSIVFVHGGKIGKDKYTLELIKAFGLINHSNSKLIIFGCIDDDYYKLINDVISKNDIKNIIFTGQLTVDEYMQIYLSSDIAVFPGGQSVLWQQAIGCGLPLIVEKNQNVNYLDLGGNVFFSESAKVEDICKAFSFCLQNDYYKKMADIAFLKGRDSFSYSRIADIVLSKTRNVL